MSKDSQQNIHNICINIRLSLQMKRHILFTIKTSVHLLVLRRKKSVVLSSLM